MNYNKAVKDLQNENKVKRMEAAEYLGKMKTESVLSYLLDTLSDESPEVRYIVVKGISQFNNKKVLGELMKSLKDPIWYVRTMAGIELEKKLKKDSESILEFFIKNDPSDLSKLFSTYALLMLNPEKLKDYIGVILNYITHDDETIRVQSLLILGDLGGINNGISNNLFAVLKDKNAKVQKAAIKALLERKTDEVKDYFLKMIRTEKDEEVKGLLIRSLEFFGGDEVENELIHRLGDKSEHIGGSAVIVLGNLHSEKGMHALIKQLKNEKRKNMKIYIEEALKKIGI